MPRLDELVAFCKVIEQRSFSHAARIIGVSQPAVSLQMKELEAEYGVQLLYRKGVEILPTEYGQVVYIHAQQIIHIYEESHQKIQLMNGKLSGRLQIGASTGPGESFVPLLLTRFKELYPDVQVGLRVGDSHEIVEGVFNHSLEMGFVGSVRRDRYLGFEPYMDDTLVLVTYPDHPWAKREFISYEEILKEPLILQQQGSGAWGVLKDALADHGIDVATLNVAMELGLQESTKVAVKGGYGVTIISELGVKKELEMGELVQIKVAGLELKRKIYITYNKSLPRSRLAQTFIDYSFDNKPRV